MGNIGKYGLFVAIGSAIMIPIVFFGIIANNDRSILLSLPNSNNQDGRSQQMNDDELESL
jgi:hypothetical protein